MLDENCGVMEKQTPRQIQGQHKGNGAIVERRNDFTPNRNGRQRRSKDSKESPVPIPRPSQKWAKSNGDKRPRQRGYFEDRQREEVAEDEDGSYEEPIYASTSRKGNGNHLLSFQYERRGSQHVNWLDYRSTPRPRQYTVKNQRYKKEQFVQARYQFVVRDSGDYAEQAINPDALVPWEMVELVRDLAVEEVKCSICLMPPMAGKVTRCGHTFCWACILHYLSTDESDKQGCPLCHQPITSEELRSVQHIIVPPVKEGEEIEMKLMRKNKGNVFVSPKKDWVDKDGKPLNIHDGPATAFNKLIVASSEQIYSDVVESEKAALAAQLLDAEDYETGYIVMAQDYLRKRERELKARIRHLSSASTTSEEEVPVVVEQEEEKAPLPSDMSFDGSQIFTTYSDAFENEADSGKPASPEKMRNVSVGEESIPFETLHEEELETSVQSVEETEAASDLQALEEEECESTLDEAVASLCDSSIPVPDGTLTASEAADHLELPHESPRGAESWRGPNRSKDIHYFYQASTGQHIYLNTLNFQCLMKEYGSLENSPDTITGTVVAIERVFIDEEMRKRFRYLNHIPLTQEIQIVELKLQAPIISKETLKAFQGEFDKRRKTRQRQQRLEKARAKKYEAEQRRRNPEYYPDYTIVTSDQYTRPHSMSDLAAAAEGGSWGSPGSPTPTPAESATSRPQEQESGSSSWSFAQIIKNGNKSDDFPALTSSSPRSKAMSVSLSAPALHQATSPKAEEEEEEEIRAPSYATSMYQAWDNVMFSVPANKEPAETTPQASGGGGKKKKKKEKQVLFSTAMARKN